MVAVVFVALGAFTLAPQVRLLLDGSKATGTVVEVARQEDSDGPTFLPVVEFTPPGAGAPLRIRGHASNPAQYQPGETVTVLYAPSAPEKAKLHSLSEWVAPVSAVLFGVLIALSGLSRRGVAPSGDDEAFHRARKVSRIAMGVCAVGALAGFVPLGLPTPLRGLAMAACFGGFFVAALSHGRTRNCPRCGAALGGENGPPLFGAVPPCGSCGLVLVRTADTSSHR